MGAGHHHHHHDHHHQELAQVGSRVLVAAVVLNVALTVVEAVVGTAAGSLALVADALHNLGDAAALVIALVARKVASRVADERYTFGYERAELIGAMLNLTSLMIMGLVLVWEGCERLFYPQPLEATWVVAAASLAVVVDLLTVVLLWRLADGGVNIRAAFLHHLTDAASSVAVIVGAIFVAWSGVTLIDPLLTLVIAAGVLLSSYNMLRSTVHILMEGTPEGVSVPGLKREMEDVPGVVRVHQIHAWQLNERTRALEAHVVVGDDVTGRPLEDVRAKLKALLRNSHGIVHATLEFEWSGTEM